APVSAVGGVVGGEAVGRVGAVPADHHIGECVAGPGIDAGVGEREVLDVGAERVAGQRGLHRVVALPGRLVHRVGGAVHDVEVVAGAAGHVVVTVAAVERVVAGKAVERVVAAETVDHVIRGRAVERVDSGGAVDDRGRVGGVGNRNDEVGRLRQARLVGRRDRQGDGGLGFEVDALAGTQPEHAADDLEAGVGQGDGLHVAEIRIQHGEV